MKRLAIALGLGVALLSVPALAAPNIVMVMTDDQTASLIDQMPNIKSLVKSKGATFTHAYFNDPLCQPSRATLLSGRYNQNTGAIDNSVPSYQRFVSSGVEGDSVAVWLRNAGYQTGFVGKYMNGYAGSRRVPPGWDLLRWTSRRRPLLQLQAQRERQVRQLRLDQRRLQHLRLREEGAGVPGQARGHRLAILPAGGPERAARPDGSPEF